MNNPPRILLVDDESLNIDYLEQELEDKGFELLSASNGQEALDVLRESLPDLVLLDIMMPEINGIAICKLIKSNQKTSHIKVMMISALSDDGTKRDSMNAGADQFVTKPILPRVLTQQVNDLMAK